VDGRESPETLAQCGKKAQAARTARARARLLTKAAALEAMAGLQTAKKDGTYIEPTRQTLGAYLDQWVKAGCGGVRPWTLNLSSLAVQQQLGLDSAGFASDGPPEEAQATVRMSGASVRVIGQRPRTLRDRGVGKPFEYLVSTARLRRSRAAHGARHTVASISSSVGRMGRRWIGTP
jgi:hypothetical protein